jgi:hypothetical protein
MTLYLQVPTLPNMKEVSMVRGQYDYWQYMCDGVDNRFGAVANAIELCRPSSHGVSRK